MILKKPNRKRWIIEHKKSNVVPLNKKGFHSVACVSWKVKGWTDVKIAEDRTTKKWEISNVSRGINGGVTISDCNRSIHLDMDGYTYKDAVNSLEKVDTLIEELKKLRKNYAKAMEVYKKGKKYYDIYKEEDQMEKVTKDTLKSLLDESNSNIEDTTTGNNSNNSKPSADS